MSCSICGGMSGTEHVLREMMFGTGDEFTYWECSGCGCLQIIDVPANIGDYYPDDYYAYSLRTTTLQLWMYQAYCRAPRLARLIRPAGVTFQSVLDASPAPGSRILDVGCGSGKLVIILRSIGFNAQGVDLFTRSTSAYLHQGSLESVKSRNWDMIMFQHSLEHMSTHIDVLRSAWEKLAPGGTCLVRIPVINWAWQHYGRDWVQLDAPRHLVIHTPQSFRLAAESAGFHITQTKYDSGAFQFYGSELYKRNIALKSGQQERLTRSTMAVFEARASELNRQQLGDQAAFFLKKSI